MSADLLFSDTPSRRTGDDDRRPLVVPDVLAFLIGGWRLERSIEDHRSGTRGTFTGEARITASDPSGSLLIPAGARYEEAGEVRFGKHRGPAHRALEYVRLDETSALVCFADGRPYIDLDLRTGVCHRVHDCGADRYEITVTARSRELLDERWVVRGPRKDYEALTRFTRL